MDDCILNIRIVIVNVEIIYVTVFIYFLTSHSQIVKISFIPTHPCKYNCYCCYAYSIDSYLLRLFLYLHHT